MVLVGGNVSITNTCGLNVSNMFVATYFVWPGLFSFGTDLRARCFPKKFSHKETTELIISLTKSGSGLCDNGKQLWSVCVIHHKRKF